MSGTEIHKRALDLLIKEDVNYTELEKCFNDFALLLDTSFMEGDEEIATLWFNLGGVCNKRSHRALALFCFKEALKTKPEFLEAINNIGYVYKKMNFNEEAREAFKKVIDLSEQGTLPIEAKNKAEYYTNYGSMFVANGSPDVAIALFDKALSISTEQRMTGYNRGLAYLEKGDFEKGFLGYDMGDRYDKIINRNYGHESLPVWDGSPGKNLVVIGEQGIGDELLFATCLPDVAKECHIVLDAHPRLSDMFRRSFSNLDVYGTRKDGTIDWGKRYKLDAKVLMGSLPKFYRKKEEDCPVVHYLKVDEKLDKYYADKLDFMGSRPKIGISWRGGTKQTGRTNRHIELEKWVAILKLDCDFISLQYDPHILKDVEEFNAKNGVKINHWPEMVENYEHTAALVKNLDLIISVPQSVVHLAGVIGSVLTWQLCPYKTLWQTGVYGKNCPWYNNVENIWQDESCNWDPVMKTVKEKLCNLLAMNTEK